MMKSRSLKKLLAAVMVVALLVMALPMTILAEPPAHAKANPGLALGHNKVKDKVEDIEEEEEPSEEEEEMSWRAEFVHERNKWAKEVAQIPPGHANLILKYLISQEDPEAEIDKSLLLENLQSLFDDLIEEKLIITGTGRNRLDVKNFKVQYSIVEEEDAPVSTVA